MLKQTSHVSDQKVELLKKDLYGRLGLGFDLKAEDITHERLFAHLCSTQWTMRVRALREIEILGVFSSSAFESALKNALQDEIEYVRAVAAQVLAQMGEKAPKGDLLLSLHDRYWQVRASAVFALGKLGPQMPIEVLMHVLENDEEPVVRIAVLQALSQFKDPVLMPTFIRTLLDDDARVRLMVVQAIGKQGTELAWKLLKLVWSSDEEEVIRHEAGRQWGKWPNRKESSAQKEEL